MNLCGTCKHWGVAEDDDGWRSNPYLTTREGETLAETDAREVELGKKHRTCSAVLNVPDGETLLATNAKAYAMDASQYSATLRTSAEFGCVMHEEKEQSGHYGNCQGECQAFEGSCHP